jgi:hypothetical protein
MRTSSSGGGKISGGAAGRRRSAFRRFGAVLAIAVLVGGGFRKAAAAPPSANFQGRLTDAASNPQTGTYALTFRIYDAESGGSAVWTETQPGVAVSNGIFNVTLGGVTSLTPAVYSADDRWLEVQIGADPPLTPRQRISSAIFALSAASVSDGAVTDAKIVSLSASKLTGAFAAMDASALTNLSAGNLTGTVANSALDNSSVTKQGNAFNTASRLVKLDSSGKLAAMDGSQLTDVPAGPPGPDTVGATQIIDGTVSLANLDQPAFDARYLDASNIGAGTLSAARLDTSSVTKQGNTFNAADRLVRLDAGGRLPALDGSRLTGVPSGPPGPATVGTTHIIDGAVTLADLDTTSIDARYLDASNIGSGTLTSARLDGSSVTKQGNEFNGAGRLVKMDAAARYPGFVANTMAADATNATDVFANVGSTMAFAVAAGENWSFEFMMQIGCTGGGGVEFGVTFAGGTFRAVALGNDRSANSIVSSVLTASGEVSAACNKGNTPAGWATITGSIRGATAGTVALQFRSGKSGQTSTVFANSYLTARKN